MEKEPESKILKKKLFRMKKRLALLKSQALQFKLIAENVSDVIWAMDSNMRFTFVSPTVRKLLGLSKEEFLQSEWIELVAPDSLRVLNRTLIKAIHSIRNGQVVDSNSPMDFEAEFLCKDGCKAWCRVQTNFTYHEGTIVGMNGSIRDISEQKSILAKLEEQFVEIQQQNEELQAFNEELYATSEELQVTNEELSNTNQMLNESNAKLELSEKKYRLLFENLFSAFVLCEVIYNESLTAHDFIFLEANSGYFQQTGKKFDEIKNKTGRQVLNSKDWDHINRWIDVAFSGNSIEFESYFIHLGIYLEGHIFSPWKGQFAIIFNNVTQRIKNNETINYLAAIINETEDHATIKDLDLRIKAANPSLIKDSKLKSLNDIIDKTDIEVFGDFPHVRKYMEDEKKAQSLPRGSFLLSEEIFVLPDGNVKYTLCKKFPVYNEKNELIATANISRDITKMKLAEIKLQGTANLLQNVIDSVGEGITLSDFEGRFDIYNKKMEEITGYNQEEANRKNIVEQIYPEHDQRIRVYRDIERLMKQGGINLVESKIQTKTGERKILSIYTTILNYLNKDYFLSVFHDITIRKNFETALRLSEERYRSIYENSSIGIYRTDLLWTITMANPALIQMLGFDNLDELKQFTTTFDGFSPTVSRRDIYAHIIGKSEVKGIESGWMLPNEKNIFVRESIKCIYDSSNEMTGFEGTIEDITEKRNAETALQESETRLRKLNATKDKFFSIIAHDLKNPFNNLLNLSMLLKNDFDEMPVSKVKMIHEYLYTTAEQGFDLLQNLLEWARTQTGTIAWKPTNTTLTDLFESSIELVLPAAQNKSIEIVNLTESKSFSVYADKNMLQTVIRNLLSNAIKFTPHFGQIFLTASVYHEFIQVCIQDNGIGIHQDDLAKLFRIDVNHSTKGTDNEEGTGLGLILCKEFIERNGGMIWVESQAGKGSKFYFTIPAATN